MRVAIDYRPALVNRDGIGRYVRELVRAMAELGFDQHLGLFGYTFARTRYSIADLGIGSAELVRLRFPSRWIPRMLGWLGKGADDLCGGADVFHHPQFNLLPVRSAVQVATIHDCIYLLDVGFMHPESAQHVTNVAREMVRRCERILVPSEYVGAEVVMGLGAHPARVTHTPLGCDHVLRGLPPEGFDRPPEPYLLTVSRVDPRKNHIRMLAAFEMLVREGFPHRWIVAGPEGWRSGDFERALRASPARERVEWRRFVPDTELPRLYARADLLLFASLNEGFGFPALEAMACGTPVVASCVTSLPEICGDAAFLVEPTDSERIFEAARRLLAEPELAREMRERGMQQARKFTWKACAKATLLAYQNATAKRTTDPALRRTL